MTPRQIEIVDIIGNYIIDHGYSPTASDIAERAGIATSRAWQHMKRLREMGIISYDRTVRTARITGNWTVRQGKVYREVLNISELNKNSA